MDSILEQQRFLHEEIDYIEQAIVNELLKKQKTHRETLLQEHRVSKLLDLISKRSVALRSLYEDQSGSLKSEIQDINSGSDLTAFYDRFNKIQQYHTKYPNEMTRVLGVEYTFGDFTAREEEELEAMFTAEESLGRYLDMHLLFDQWFTLNQGKKISYLEYLNEFGDFDKVKKSDKLSRNYKNYLDDLLEYLRSFMKKSQPMYNIEEFEESNVKMFDIHWSEGKFADWSGKSESKGEEIYCDVCQKGYAKGVYQGHLTGKKHMKAMKSAVTKTKDESQKGNENMSKEDGEAKAKEVCRTEVLITGYFNHLSTVRQDTRSRLENKQVLGDSEKNEDMDVGISDHESESETEDPSKIYNPLKLPLGWDGKPIPYWLYKLHGLGVEYECEICGGYIYMGRKVFDKHFQEWRHAHGMRCLGIPNTRHFQDITKMDDAFALWEKLKMKKNESEGLLALGDIEEFEDDEGNVFGKKTFEDLKRQGLI
ncbi:hypothetical protein HK098_006575 [Nowakowskiella sp. JEL0407]|nr:hypothetical protein HK098_006575 [Nowakowskiella sp. JEL0407]